MKVGLSATLPDTQSGKLLVDYVNKKVHIKSSVGMTTQPKVTVSAASGYKNVVFGAEAAYDTAKSVVSNYGLALGLHAGDSQLAVHLQVIALRQLHCINVAMHDAEDHIHYHCMCITRFLWNFGAGLLAEQGSALFFSVAWHCTSEDCSVY